MFPQHCDVGLNFIIKLSEMSRRWLKRKKISPLNNVATFDFNVATLIEIFFDHSLERRDVGSHVVTLPCF